MTKVQWRCVYVAAFVIGFLLGVVFFSPAKAQEGQMQAVKGKYGMICPMDATTYLAANGYKEVNKWISSDGSHLWVMYENDTNWLLVMTNALSRMSCFFDIGDVEQKDS